VRFVFPVCQPSGLVQTDRGINNQMKGQMFVQNCTNLQYFVVHDAHGVKAYQVTTQPMAGHLKFSRWSFCQNTEDYQKTNNYAKTH
jgi:hypothetical protein